jgi:hypothetical protein
MPICNPDGTPYQLSGSLQQFDPENPEIDLFNTWDQEVIEIVGTPIYYYEVFIQSNTVDPLYMEDRGKLYSDKPICLYGFYNPIPSQNFMSTFGVDSPDELMFEFNYKDVLARLGHPPKIGSRLFTPHRRENWKILQCNVEEFKLWGEMRLQVMCEKFQEDRSIGEGRVTQAAPTTDPEAIRKDRIDIQ